MPACVAELSPLQRKVLRLRAGVGAGPPRSRQGVASRLDLSVRRVTRLERSGLARLRSLGRSGGCGGGVVAPAALATANVAAGTTAAVAAAAPKRGGSGGGGKPGGSGGSGSGSSSGGGGGSGGVGGEFATAPAVGGGSSGGTAAWIPIVLAALAALSAGYLAVGGVRSLRERRH
jgi:hypothetical protein